MKKRFTLVQRIRGLRGAIASPHTPDHLKPHIAKQLRRLEAQRPKPRSSKVKVGTPIMEWFAL